MSCTAASFCMAVGSYDSPLGTQRPLAESWNGSRWRIEAAADPGGGSLYGVSCTAASFCMAVGTYEQTAVSGVAFAESWDGTSWSLRTAVNPSPTANDLYGVSCTAADACIAVGSYAYDHPGHRAAVVLAEAWNGTTWGQQPTPATDGIMFSVSCAAAGACAAVGYSGDNAKAGIWNGTTWTFSRLPLPPNGGQGGLDDVSCTAPDECTAVGSYAQFLPGSTGLALGEEWNGTAWVNQPVPSPRHAQASALTGISCPTASACTAVGVHYPNFTDYGVGVPFAEHRA